MKVGIVGLGYVGIPLFCALLEREFNVVGFDINAECIEKVNRGINPLPDRDSEGLSEILKVAYCEGRIKVSVDPAVISECDLVTINVPTPVLRDGTQSLVEIRSAVDLITPFLKHGVVVLVESTVVPGTTDIEVAARIAQSRSWRESVDFFVAMSPERVMPGKALKNLIEIPRVCGTSSSEAQAILSRYFSELGCIKVDFVSVLMAETVKVVENTYRDVQIAFANEVATVATELNLDVQELISLVNKVPHRHMHQPGGGVGGHCIPKDSLLLALSVATPLQLVQSARVINDLRPFKLAELVEFEIGRFPLSERLETDVCILGYSYLPESGDTRNSPSVTLAQELDRRGLSFEIHDPYITNYSSNLDSKISGSTIIVRMVEHSQYQTLDLTGKKVVRSHESLPQWKVKLA